MIERALTRAAVAERLGVSVQTVRRLVDAGSLPPPRRVTPGHMGHLESEVTEYLRSRPVLPLTERTAAATRARAAQRSDADRSA